MSSCTILDLSSSEKWNLHLLSLPIELKDIYFTPEYYSLYEKLGDGKAKCFVFEEGKELALYPFLMNSVNEVGFNLNNEYYDIQGAYGYNGVIASNNNLSFINKFHKAFNDFCQSNKVIAEFTRFHPLLKNNNFSETNMVVSFDRKTMFIDLRRNYEDIFKSFQTTTRKQIKRGHNKYNIEVEIIENDTSKIEQFYSIYKESMDRVKSGEYLYFNLEYFKNLILTTKSALFMAYYEGKPISAIIVFYNTTYIHGHLGGALTEYLFTSSFSLLYSEIIKFGIEKKCSFFHAGGGNTNIIDDKLLQFKLNFSNTTADFIIGKKIHNSKIYNEVVKNWSERFPEKTEKYKNFILKYRY